jgi:crossover junction endodeoxyribonuclease RusA
VVVAHPRTQSAHGPEIEGVPVTSFELDIPLHRGNPPLTLNQRLNHYEKNRRTQTIRDAVGWRVKAAKIGSHQHVTVQLHYATGDNRGRDTDNLVATQKPAVDALVSAGVIPDDTPQHLTWWAPAIHNGPGKRRLWITVEVRDRHKTTEGHN